MAEIYGDGLKDLLDTVPNPTIQMTAGPSQIHRVAQNTELLSIIERTGQAGHRTAFAKALITRLNAPIRDAFGMAPEAEDYKDDKDYLLHTASGTDGMTRAVYGTFEAEGQGDWEVVADNDNPAGFLKLVEDEGITNLLLDTDNFSTVALQIARDARRNVAVLKFKRGEGLRVDSPLFEAICNLVEDGRVKTVYGTENGTSTGVNIRSALEAMVARRNASESGTIIVADGVSAQVMGVKRDAKVTPDVFFTSFQKDAAVGKEGGVLRYNQKALERAKALKAKGVPVLDKLGLIEGHKKGRDQTQETPDMAGLMRSALIWNEVHPINKPEVWQAVGEMQSQARTELTDAVENSNWADRGMRMTANSPDSRSNTAHVIRLAGRLAGKSSPIRKDLAKAGIEVSAGYGDPNKDNELRVCVYSANTLREVQEVIGAIDEAVRRHAA